MLRFGQSSEEELENLAQTLTRLEDAEKRNINKLLIKLLKKNKIIEKTVCLGSGKSE